MPPRAFISYSRRNRPYAERLRLDLRRAGTDAWLDAEIPSDSPSWEDDIRRAIGGADRVVLLASPEAVASPQVGRELARAADLGKTVTTLLVAGDIGRLPPDWQRRQVMTRAVLDHYWPAVRGVAGELGAAGPDCLRPVTALLDEGNMTVAQAADELGGSPAPRLGGREFRALPVYPSGYGAVWLFAPADGPLRWPEALAVLFQHTGSASPARYEEAIAD